MSNFVYCNFCDGEYNKASGEHVCEIGTLRGIIQEGAEFGDLSPQRKAEIEERIVQVEEWEAAGRGHIRVSTNFPMKWGGSRPNSGGSRPNSGPLPGVIRNFHPFAHREKGNTESRVSWEFSRCNSCGAMGWEPAEDEMLWNSEYPEGEGWRDVNGLPGKPLVHAEDCTNRV
jgi:hypothetical protein